jgi:nucleotide-binding universal stress UspA family protein
MRSSFEHILVPLDFAPKNQAAAHAALEMARGRDVRVTLLHVIEPIEATAEDEDIQEFLAGLVARADADLERFAQPFTEAGIAVDYRVTTSPRAAGVVDFACEHGVDLIVLSSHPIDRQQPAESLNTLSYQISIAAECSVLLVKT